MILPTRRFLVTSSLAFASIAFTASRAQVAPPDGWHPVTLGFAPQVLLAGEQSMWAAGAQESLAVSTDGGQHWTLKHSDQGGALLLVLHFVNGKFGYAAGTGGKVLFTQDGGETWSAQKLADSTILQAAFGDPMHGVIRTRSALLSTIDGGKTWHAVAPANDAEWQKKFPYTDDLAAIDKDHLAVRVNEGEFSDGEYLWTGDGGATWFANYIPNVGIHGLIVSDGAYYSIGHEVLGKDKPGGGYGVAMSFRSHDGIQWDHVSLANGVCKSEACGGCTPQGCFAGKGSAVDLDNGKNWLATFPPHDGLSREWARSGDSLCLLSNGAVECTAIKDVKSLDAPGQPVNWQSRSLTPLGAPQRQASGPECIRCQLPPLFVTKTGDTGPVDVQINFTLESSGQADNVMIVGKVPQEVISQIRALIAGWLFEPVIEDGKPIAKQLGMRGRLMIMNPEKPGPGMQSPASR
jgi:hypothetical protein